MLTLTPYQEAALERFKNSPTLILFWEMRLGKTVVAIRWAEMKRKKRILVVCPVEVIETWEEALDDEGHRYVVLSGKVERRVDHVGAAGARWHITNIQSLAKHRVEGRRFVQPTVVSSFPWDIVIIDESASIRSPKAATTKVANTYLASAPLRGILSGLPNPEGELDYFEQMRFALGQFCGYTSYWKFRAGLFCNSFGWNWSPRRGSLDLIKRSVRESASVLTRKEVNVGGGKRYEKVFCDLPKKLRKVYDNAERDFVLGERDVNYILEVRSFCSKIASGCHPDYRSDHKLKLLLHTLQNYLRNNSCIVYFRYTSEIRAVSELFKKKKLSHVVIHGGIPREERKRLRIKVREGKAQYALCQTKCVRYGLNWSFLDSAVFFTNWDDYDTRAQAEDRIIHMQRKHPSLILDLLVRNTIEVDRWEALKDKKTTARNFNNKLIENMIARYKANASVD